MKSFWWLVQRLTLTLLLGAVPLTVASCGDDDVGSSTSASVVLTALEISPSNANVAVDGKLTFELSSATVEVDGDEMSFDNNALEDLDKAVDDGEITPAQRDAIYAVIETVSWASSDSDVASVSQSDPEEPEEGATQVPSLQAEATGEEEGSSTISATIAGSVADAADTESGDVVAEADLTVGDAPAESLSVDPETLTLASGSTRDVVVTAVIDGEEEDVTDDADYGSSDDDVATAANGAITGGDPGTATITITYRGQTAAVAVTVEEAEPSIVSLAISPTDSSILVGEESEYSVTATLSDDTEEDVTADADFESDDTDVVSFDDNVAKGESAGEVEIKATVGDEFVVTKLTVADIAIESVTVLPPAVTIPAGTDRQLEALAKNNDGTDNDDAVFTWSSSDETVATVEADTGLVTAVGEGTTTITAEVDGVEGTSEVTVREAEVASLSIEPATVEIALGFEQAFTAAATFENDQTVFVTGLAEWTSSNEAVATINDDGLATSRGEGTTTITATYQGETAMAELTVTEKTIRAIVVSGPTSTNLGIAVNFSAEAQFSDATTQDVTGSVDWASDDLGVATIDGAGLLTPVAVGPATISAELDGETGTAVIAVLDEATTEVVVTPAGQSLPIGRTLNASAQANGSNGGSQDVTLNASWASDDNSIATVSTSGVITGVSEGTANISATFDDRTGSIAVIVTDAEITSIAVTPATSDIAIGLTTGLTATATFTDDSTLDVTADPNVTWSSSASDVASVSNLDGAKGEVTGVADGPGGAATITATFADGTTTASGEASVFISTKVAVSLAVLPPSESVPAGFTVEFRAEATYSDGSTETVTDQVTWSSGDSAIASVSVQGQEAVAFGVAPGVTTINAALPVADGDPLAASGDLTVESRTLASIQVDPADTDLAKGGTQQYTATGIFTEGPSIDITRVVSWTVVQPADCVGNCIATPFDSYVTVSNENESEGVATAVESTVDTDTGDIYKAVIRAAVGEVSGTATLGVTSNVIVDVLVSVEDDDGNDARQLAVGSTLDLVADCTFEDGLKELDCQDRIVFTRSNTSATLDNTNNLITGAGAGTLLVSANPPAGASDSVSINEVSIQVLDCVYDGVEVFFEGEEGTPDLPLGSTAQAFARLVDSTETCDDVVLNSAVSWQSTNTVSLDVDQTGAVVVSTDPVPAVEDWLDVGDAPGLTVNVQARYFNGAVEVTGQGPVTLRDACIDTLVLTPAISTTMPIVPGNAPVTQPLQVTGQFNIDLPDAVLTGETGLAYTAAADGVTVIAPAGTLQVDGSDADITAGVKTIAVSATGLTTVDGNPICAGGATGSTEVTLVNSGVASLTVTPASDSLGVGQSNVQISAAATFEDASLGSWDVTNVVDWSSSNTAVLTVSVAGVMNSVGGQGSSVVSADLNQSGSVITDSVTIEVRDRVLEDVLVGVDPAFAPSCGFVTSALEISVGGVPPEFALLDASVPTGVRFPLKAYAVYSNGEEEEVTSLATFAASTGVSVSIDGASFTTSGLGDAGVTATFVGVTSDALEFTVTNPDIVGFVVTPPLADGTTADTLPVGTSKQYGADATWDGGKECDVTEESTWSVDPGEAGTTTQPGLIRLANDNVGADVDFVATYGSPLNTAVRNILVGDTCAVSLTVSPSDSTVLAGSTTAIVATLTLSDGSTLLDPGTVITWESDDVGVATTGPDQLNSTFVADEAGDAVLTATYTAGVDICDGSATLEATADVTVQADIVSIAVDCDNASADDVGPNFEDGSLRDRGPAGAPALPVGVRGYCTAVATFTEGDPMDVTDVATWSTTAAELSLGAVVAKPIAGEDDDVNFKTFSTLSASASPVTIEASYAGAGQTAVTGETDDFYILAPSAVSVIIRDMRGAGAALVNDSLPVFDVATSPKQYEAVGIFTIDGEDEAYDLTDIATWVSQEPVFATVSATGSVQPLTAGSTVISATSSGESGSFTLTVEPDSCASISIQAPGGGSPTDEDLALGQSAQYIAECTLLTSGDVVDVTDVAVWTSGLTSIATVTPGNGASGGLVAAGTTIGTSTITAALDGVTDSFDLDVTAACKEEARFVETAQNLQSGDTVPVGVPLSFVLEVRESTSDSFEVLEGEDVERTVAADDEPVTTTVEFCTGEDDVDFVYTPDDADVVAVTVAPGTASVPQGLSVFFTASASFVDFAGTYDVTESDDLVWSSANTALASSEGSGEFQANSASLTGNTTATATLLGDESDQAALTVTSAILESIRAELFVSTDTGPCELPSESVNVLVTPHYSDAGATHPKGGFTTQVRVIGVLSDETESVIDSAVFSDDSESTSVSSSGVIVTGAAGDVVITATAANPSGGADLTDAVTLTVADSVLGSVTVTAANGATDEAALALGQDSQLQLIGTFGGTDYCITPDGEWSTTNPNPVTVSASGVVNGIALGTDSVQGGIGGINDAISVVVSDAEIASLEIIPGSLDLTPNSSGQLRAFATLTDGSVIEVTSLVTEATWSVSAGVIAAPSVEVSNGLVTSGSALETVTVRIDAVDNDEFDSVQVIVAEAP